MKDQAEVRCREEERRGVRGIFSVRRANSAQMLYTSLLLLVLVYRMDDVAAGEHVAADEPRQFKTDLSRGGAQAAVTVDKAQKYVDNKKITLTLV